VRRLVVLCSIATLAASPAAALAQAPVVAPPRAPAQAPAPAPLQTQMQLGIARAGGARATVLVGSRIRVRGTVGAFVPGESVTVRFSAGDTTLRVESRAILPGPDATGLFELSYRAERSGKLVVQASHPATAALGELAATGRTIDVIPRSVGRHSRARAVRALQRRLRRLGYVVGRAGSYDARTARAVIAFRKVTGIRRSGDASVAVMRRIARGKGAFTIRRPGDGRHIEADLTRQVIALVDGGRVRRIYPISSGKPGTSTVLGSFRVYLKTRGTNARGMVDSAYFVGGYATHGYPSVPVYPASHGCLRVPLADAASLFKWIHIGTPVDVYYGPRPR
jgi:peptidoglycan hydrolase-like protein with peptidoglycan-binding domain